MFTHHNNENFHNIKNLVQHTLGKNANALRNLVHACLLTIYTHLLGYFAQFFSGNRANKK